MTDFRLGIIGQVGVGTYNDAASFDDFSVRNPAIPEPGTLILAALGLSALAGYARRRRPAGPVRRS